MNTVQVAAANTISLQRRLGSAALSGLYGWLASQLICLPFNLITAVRDTEGQPRLFVETLWYGLLAWGGWTLLLACFGWLLVALPLVLLVRPCLLVRLRRRILVVAVVIAAAVTGSQWKAFQDMGAVSVFQRFAVMIPYGSFVLTFAVVTAAAYIQMSKRRLDGPVD